MSNEYREWLEDRVCEVLFDALQVDRVEEVIPSPNKDIYIVRGRKNGEKVAFAVWFDDDVKEWEMEHRETDK